MADLLAFLLSQSAGASIRLCSALLVALNHSRKQISRLNIPPSFRMRRGDFFKAFDGEIAVGVGHVVPDARAIEQGR